MKVHPSILTIIGEVAGVGVAEEVKRRAELLDLERGVTSPALQAIDEVAPEDRPLLDQNESSGELRLRLTREIRHHHDPGKDHGPEGHNGNNQQE
jgi:hypothetical protein